MKVASFPLVAVINGEPMASSLVIAKGMRAKHRNVIQLVRNHQLAIEQLGRVAFEMQSFGTAGGTQAREVALLNEQQTALLISLMRNSKEVVEFKVRLIREFYRMRDALDQRSQNLYQQLQELVAEEVSTQVKASFGSRLMLERKKAIPEFKRRRERLESEIQPSLKLH